jgi:hypothetical protein
MTWNGIDNGENSPDQVDANQRTGVIDEDGNDFVNEDNFPDPDVDEDGEGVEAEGDNE